MLDLPIFRVLGAFLVKVLICIKKVKLAFLEKYQNFYDDKNCTVQVMSSKGLLDIILDIITVLFTFILLFLVIYH
jgi:hypothetical protein